MGTRDIREITYGYKMLKFAMNLTDDGMVGQQVLQVTTGLYDGRS
jgi:1,4-dihydroxy-2-naphthoyl-CoA synthase